MGCASSGPASGLIGTAQDAVGDTIKAGEHMVTDLGDQAKESLTHGVEHVKDAMGAAMTSVEHGISTAVGTIGDTLGIHQENAVQAVTDQMSEAETVVASEAEAMMDEMLTETSDMKSELADLDTMKTNMLDGIEAEASKLSEVVENANIVMEEAAESAQQLTNGMEDAAQNLAEQAGDQLVQVGDEIVESVQIVDANDISDAAEPAISSPADSPVVEEPTSPPTLWEQAHDAIVLKPSRPSMEISEAELQNLQLDLKDKGSHQEEQSGKHKNGDTILMDEKIDVLT